MQYDGNPASQRDNLPVVEFYHDTREDKGASAKAGRPIFTDIEMVKIRFPADRQRSLVRPAHSEWTKIKGEKITYAMRFQDQYKRFKANDTQVVDGTPLAEAPFLTQAQRMSFKALDIYTIEQLASLTGQPLRNIGAGGVELVEKAKAYLQTASGTADVTKLAADLAAAQAIIAQLQAGQAAQAPSAHPSTPFSGMSDDDLKQLISDKTGARPRGNPRRETLERMAMELTGSGQAMEVSSGQEAA